MHIADSLHCTAEETQYCQGTISQLEKKRKQIKIHKYLKITMGINDFRKKMNLTFDN